MQFLTSLKVRCFPTMLAIALAFRLKLYEPLLARPLDPEAPDTMTDDGILALCDALAIDAQDPVMLALSWTMDADAMCVFTRTEFVRGLEKLECKSIADVRAKLPSLRKKLHERQSFADIYSVRTPPFLLAFLVN